MRAGRLDRWYVRLAGVSALGAATFGMATAAGAAVGGDATSAVFESQSQHTALRGFVPSTAGAKPSVPLDPGVGEGDVDWGREDANR